MKPGLYGRPQDIGGARAIGSLSRSAAYREWSQPTGEKCVVSSRSGKGQAAQPFEIGHGTPGLEFALLAFGLTLVHDFLSVFHSFPLE